MSKQQQKGTTPVLSIKVEEKKAGVAAIPSNNGPEDILRMAEDLAQRYLYGISIRNQKMKHEPMPVELQLYV